MRSLATLANDFGISEGELRQVLNNAGIGSSSHGSQDNERIAKLLKARKPANALPRAPFNASARLDLALTEGIIELKRPRPTMSLIDKINHVIDIRAETTKNAHARLDKLLAQYQASPDKLEKAAQRHEQVLAKEEQAYSQLDQAIDRLANSDPLGE